MDLLIVDDDAITRLSVRQLCEEQGYDCAEAENGLEAVELARESPPRLILLDVMMPELDGFGAARLLRADPATRHVPILFLTGRNDWPARRPPRRAGETTFVTKPFDDYQLLDVVSIELGKGPTIGVDAGRAIGLNARDARGRRSAGGRLQR